MFARQNFYKLLLGTTLFSSISLFSIPASAQDGGVLLDAISIYAQKGETSAFQVPGMVTIVNKDEIDDLVANSYDDVFKGIPGVAFDGGPRRAGLQPSIRGFDSDSILILFDDARQSFQSAHDGRFLIDPDILKQVEIVRGPSSALYGSGTIGGVIAFQTIDAKDLLQEGETTGVRVKSSYHSVDNERGGAITGYHASKDGFLDLVAHFTYRDGDDITLGSGFDLPSNDRITNGLLKAKTQLTPDTTLTGSWLYTQLKGRDPQNPQGVNVGSSTNPNVDRENTSDTLQVKLEHNPENNSFLDLKIVGYRTFNEVKEPEVDSNRVTSREVETYGFSAQNRSKFLLSDNVGLLLTYGGEYYNDDQIGSDSSSANGTRGGVPNAQADFYGAFIQGEFAFTDTLLPGKLTFTPGVRFDKFETSSQTNGDTSQTATSPKMAISYEPVKWLMLFGNYGEAFRAPSFNEVYALGTHFSLGPPNFFTNEFIPNPDLKPEEAEGWEIGMGFQFENVFAQNDGFKIKGAYWESDVTNLIDLDVNVPGTCFGAPFGPPCGSGAAFGNTSQNINVDSAELSGFELEMSYDSSFIYAKATYSHIAGKDTVTGEYVGILTPDKFYLDAGVKLADYDLRLGARATIADKFDKVNSAFEVRDAYSVFDIYAVWEPAVVKGLRLDLGIDNITDEDYEVVNSGVSEPGRDYKVAVSYKMPFCLDSSCQ